MFQKNDYVLYKKNVCIVKDIKQNAKNRKESYFHPMIFKIGLRRALKDHFSFTWSPPARNEI